MPPERKSSQGRSSTYLRQESPPRGEEPRSGVRGGVTSPKGTPRAGRVLKRGSRNQKQSGDEEKDLRLRDTGSRRGTTNQTQEPTSWNLRESLGRVRSGSHKEHTFLREQYSKPKGRGLRTRTINTPLNAESEKKKNKKLRNTSRFGGETFHSLPVYEGKRSDGTSTPSFSPRRVGPLPRLWSESRPLSPPFPVTTGVLVTVGPCRGPHPLHTHESPPPSQRGSRDKTPH